VSKLAWISALATLFAVPAAAETAIPDLKGTWTGESESIVLGAGNQHHRGKASAEPRLSSVAFTMVIDKQDGRRFSGTFSSARGTEKIIAVVSRTGAFYLVDEDGFTIGSILAPNRLELCYMQQQAARVASGTEMTKKP